MQDLKYIKLNYDYKLDKWDHKSYTRLFYLFSLWDSSHKIITIDPNFVFANKPIKPNKQEIKKIDWEDVLTKINYNANGYFVNDLPDCNKSINYMRKHLSKAVLNPSTNIKPPISLAVVEQDEFGNNLVRAIIKADLKDFYFAVNPVYLLSMPKTEVEIRTRWENCLDIKEFLASVKAGQV